MYTNRSKPYKKSSRADLCTREAQEFQVHRLGTAVSVIQERPCFGDFPDIRWSRSLVVTQWIDSVFSWVGDTNRLKIVRKGFPLYWWYGSTSILWRTSYRNKQVYFFYPPPQILLLNNVVQRVKELSTNLVSLKFESAVAFIIFTFPKNF